MKYGFFNDAEREYIVTTPETPYPWTNYLGSQDFFSLISNLGGGYCFYQDARLRRLLRYRFNSIPTDSGGRYFYIRDGDDFWTHTFMPVKKELDQYECRHGLGYTKITGQRNQLEVHQLSLVPLNYNAEVHHLRLKNLSSHTKKIKLFSFIEFCLWNAYDDAVNLQRNLNTGEVEIEANTIYHKTEYRERRNHYAFYSLNTAISGFDTDRESFVGLYNGLDAPRVVVEGESRNSIASGWAPIASHCVDISLKPQRERDLIFVLGYIENEENDKWVSPGVINKTKALSVIKAFSKVEQVRSAFDQLADYWSKLLSKYHLESEDEKLNRMVNIWNPYQCMVTFNISRSASYFETGVGRGMGFRDSNQDLLGFVHMVPDRARQRIIDIATTQFPDGSAYHQYQPLTKRGNHDIGSGFNDDPLWLILAVADYTKETGDYDILKEKVPFDNNPNNVATLFEHLKCSFDYVYKHRGPHGLPLIGRADWNDCLNLNCFSKSPEESFQTTENKKGGIAESVFIAAMFVFMGREYMALASIVDEEQEVQRARVRVAKMEAAIIESGFDGEWFLRAYDYFGNKVGSRECKQGKIFIETQGFCVMAGVGIQQGLATKALESVKTHLDTPYGIMLQQPAYTKYQLELGEISSYPPGYKENAGIFCHNNPWIMIAESRLGRREQAFEYYKKIAPAYLEDRSEIHRMEPYIYSQMIAGKDAPRFGEAKNSWLTGTAAWNYVAISQYLLGIKPEHEGLRIHPCISKDLRRLTITRFCRGAVYTIQVDNRSNGTEVRLRVNGKSIDGHIVPYARVGERVSIDCTIS